MHMWIQLTGLAQLEELSVSDRRDYIKSVSVSYFLDGQLYITCLLKMLDSEVDDGLEKALGYFVLGDLYALPKSERKVYLEKVRTTVLIVIVLFSDLNN